MKLKKQSILWLAVVAALSGCVDDGKDGEQGPVGPPGEDAKPPVVDHSIQTKLTVLSHQLEQGKVSINFEIIDENNRLIDGLDRVEIKFAELSEQGINMSRSADGGQGGWGEFIAGVDSKATLISDAPGQYRVELPMANVDVGDEGILWLRVGGGDADIAQTLPTIVAKSGDIHTTTTDACFSCHVDYGTSDNTHADLVARAAQGDIDFVGGCSVCHNSTPQSQAGFAKTTLSAIGHKRHQAFETDFEVMNCFTCHQDSVPINTSPQGPGCYDCHDHSGGSLPVGKVVKNDSGIDYRQIHAEKFGVLERAAQQQQHHLEITPLVADGNGKLCASMTLKKGEQIVDIKELVSSGHISYAKGYMHGYDVSNDTIMTYVDNAPVYHDKEGVREMCYDASKAVFDNNIVSARVSLIDPELPSASDKDAVTLHAYSDPSADDAFERRQVVKLDGCTTCHNSESDYHKAGSFANGGYGCMACHNNAQDRGATRCLDIDTFANDQEAAEHGFIRGSGELADFPTGGFAYCLYHEEPGTEAWITEFSGVGFGPLIHAWHWGNTSYKTEYTAEGEPKLGRNSAEALAEVNCVACHYKDEKLLENVPNQYIASKAFNGSIPGVMTSPVMANCVACHEHQNDAAINHMQDNGGELNVPQSANWTEQPTAESCAVCHDIGSAVGVDKFHRFDE